MSRPKKCTVRSSVLPAAKSSDVEEILRAAEDEILMDLQCNSHTISSSSLDLDLSRRFETLKNPNFHTSSKSKQPIAETNELKINISENNDLMKRFAALKNPRFEPEPVIDPILYRDDSDDDEHSEEDEVGDKVSKKEVEKVILWAMDAARLDDFVGNNEENEVEEFVDQKKKRDKGKGLRGKRLSLFR